MVVDQAEDDNSPRHQDSVIHILSRDGSYRWPEAEKYHHGQITTCEGIIRDAPVSRYAPGAPIELHLCGWVRHGGRFGGICRFFAAAI